MGAPSVAWLGSSQCRQIADCAIELTRIEQKKQQKSTFLCVGIRFAFFSFVRNFEQHKE